VFHTYDWDISIDGAAPSRYTRATVSDAAAYDGITLSGLTVGDHQIEITPHNAPEPGWGNAFGHDWDNTSGANITANKEKLISLDAPLTTMAFAPNPPGNTSAASMFAGLFEGCTNLTAPATFLDTCQLSDTVTDLSRFLYRAHRWNSTLTTPIEFTPLSRWLNANTSITNLARFLSYIHSYSPNLTTPINLTPLSGWFDTGTSISNLSNFLFYTHADNR
jgi:hypothetical protein